MIKENVILGIFIAIISMATLSALTITVNVEPSFGIGEEISFDYTFLSPTNQEIQYIASVNCPTAPAALLDLKNASLTANVPLKGKYIFISSLKDNIESQTCRAIVSVLNPEQTEEKNFSILTNPSFDFNFLACKDSSCSEQTRVFVLNRDIYLDYESHSEGIIATAKLTYPDGNTEELTLPASINAEQIGTYDLEINAVKQGYKTFEQEVQIGVIEREANIGYGSTGKTNKNIILWVIILAAGIVLIGALIYLIYRRRNK